jgi:hypothetical protein
MGTKKLKTILVLLSLSAVCLSGCVQRRFIIRSQPEGAFVTIDNTPIGYTPLKVPYTYDGTREIQLEKDGFKTIQVSERFQSPWYLRFPTNFFTENFAGREIRQERLLDFELEPRTQVQENLLLERANDLRHNIERGTVTAPIW